MEKKRVVCEANTKEKFNKGLVKEAKTIVSRVEGLNKTASTRRAADVRAAFGEKTAPAKAKPAAAKASAAKKTVAKAATTAKKTVAKAATATKPAAKKVVAKAKTTAKPAMKVVAKAKPAVKAVAKPAMKTVAKKVVAKAKPAAKNVAKMSVHKTAVGRAIAAVERAVGIKALAAPTSKGMRTSKSVAKPAGKTMAKATPQRPLPKPAGMSKGNHSGDLC